MSIKNYSVIVALICSLTLISCKEKSKKICITQIVEHVALDKEREALIKTLKEKGIKHEIIYQNAQGNIVTARQIIEKFTNENPDVIITISTPSSQSALSLCERHNIPLVCSAVTDFVSAKLKSEKILVTGVSDYLDPKPQIEFLISVVPNVKTVGVLYNPSETNSVKAYQDLKKEADIRGIMLIEGTTTKTSEVSMIVNSMIGKVDAIYVPNDNTFVSSMVVVSKIAHEHKIPVIAADVGSVQNGAACALAYDRSILGKYLAEQVMLVLDGKRPNILKNHKLQIYKNKKETQKLNLNQINNAIEFSANASK